MKKIGIVFIILGITLFILKAVTTFMDSSGFIYENMLFTLGGGLFIVIGIIFIIIERIKLWRH